MPTESFLDATEEELLKIANQCMERAGSALQVPPQNFDDFTRLRLFLEAQSCLAEVARKQAERTAERDRQRNEEIARRDFWMEVGVMVLIGVEIVLSVVGLREGSKQGRILADMDASSAATASAMSAVSKSLQSLADAQAESLKILQRQEADRLAQLTKKPELVLFVGHVPLARASAGLKPSQESDTTATFDFVLKNIGDATANKVIWRALVPPDVNLFSNTMPVPGNDLPDRPVRAFLYFQDLIPSKSYAEVTITFSFPKGHPPFEVAFNATSPDLTGEKPLGVLQITPRMPSK